MRTRLRLRRRPAATTLLPALFLLSMASAGGFSTGVSSSQERIVEIVVTADAHPAQTAPGALPLPVPTTVTTLADVSR